MAGWEGYMVSGVEQAEQYYSRIRLLMERKNPNKFKAFYQLNKARKSMDYNSMDYKHLEEPFIQLLMETKTPPNPQYDDSFDQLLNPPEPQKEPLETQTKPSSKTTTKLFHHARSQSCPYITPNFQENIKNQNSSPLGQVPEERPPRYSLNKDKDKDLGSPESKKLRKLNNMILPFAKRSQPRNSMLSQSSQSVVIHNNLASSLSIDAAHPLSYMLYSEKKNQAETRKPIQKVSRKYFENAGEDTWRKTKYLKIKLQQQIKKYELNNDLRKLQKETNDINIKQGILQGILRKSDSENKYLGYETNESFLIDQAI